MLRYDMGTMLMLLYLPIFTATRALVPYFVYVYAASRLGKIIKAILLVRMKLLLVFRVRVRAPTLNPTSRWR